MLNIGGGVAVASLAPNAGDGAEKPPNEGAAAGAGEAADVPPNANGEFATGVVGAAKLNVDADAGGVGDATAPNPPKTGAGAGAEVAPKGFEAGGAPKPVAAGAGAPKLGAVELKLNEVEAAGEAVELAPNPPNAGADDGAGAGVVLAPKLKGELAGFAASATAGAGALLEEPKVNAELAAGFDASAGAPNVNEDFDVKDGAGAGAGLPKLNVGVEGVGVALVWAGAPKRLGVVVEAGAFTSDVAGVELVLPNENELVEPAGLSAAGAGVEETEANGFPAGSEDATAEGTTGAALAGGAVEKLKRFDFGGATLGWG